jgi:hypothetical protein
MRRLTLALLTGLAALAFSLAGCGSDAEDLQGYLRDEWGFDGLYDDITGITVADGVVTISGNEKITETLAMRLCDWASPWVYEHGDADWDIRVVEEQGRLMSERRHANDACSFGG